MRLLFLVPFAPRLDADHGGGRIIGQFLAGMVSRHEVAILYLRSPAEPPIDQSILDQCALAREVSRPTLGKSLPHRLLRIGQIAQSLASRRPIWVHDWSSREYAEQARRLALEFHPDIIQAEYHLMGQYLAGLADSRAPRVLVEHEPGQRAAPYLQQGPAILRQAIRALERVSWKRYESGIARQLQAIITFTGQDQGATQSLADGTPVYRIPPGYSIPPRALDPLGVFPGELLFIGNFYHPANVDGAVRLIQSIYPAVLEKCPETQLTIVGEAPPAQIRKAFSEKVHVTGRVPDVTPYLERAAVFVAPLRSGGGVRVKVMEALAAGRAVVATHLAAEGLDLVDGSEIMLAESDADLADQIVRLLADDDLRAAVASRGRAWACRHLKWEDSIRAYESLYASLLEMTHTL